MLTGEGPLAGVRVVDFSAVVSGPLATMWLADQGADVIKIEALDLGDVSRSNAGAPELHGLAGLYMNCNRGKRAVAVDVGTPAGRQIVLDLCATADVFVQNWRPGVADRLGLGFAAVSAVKPDIVYVSISGFGTDGPYAQRRVYDAVVQGLAGYVAAQTNPDIPIPDLVRTIVCDKATSLTVAQAVCAALFARERGAGGQHIEVPMLDTAVSFLFPDGYMAKALLDDAKSDIRPTMTRVYRVSPTADGYIIYYTANMTEMFGLFRALGHPEWCEDPRFSTAIQLRANREALGALISAGLEQHTTAELCARFEAEDVPFAPANDLDDVVLDPQIVHNGAMRVREHPVAGRVLEARHPVRFSATPVPDTHLAPAQGEHTDDVLIELGRDAAQIAALHEAGVVRGPKF